MKITEDLVRRRAEHNEKEIYTLEEVSLHQFDIEKIENLDKWCKKLKILYLQNNLISKIENVSRLKQLEYLNLALNNIERIENLQNCESLVKLDLTVNFIGELSSIENLKNLQNFEEIFLIGNPCAEYIGYREYVIATLLNLKTLDGVQVEKSERIRAIQNFEENKKLIETQQNEYIQKRNLQKEKEKLKEQCDEREEYTPESRIRMHKQTQKQNEKSNESQKEENRTRKLFMPDGRPMNINEPKIVFNLTDQEDENCYNLDLHVYKYLDSSLIDVDLQPTYVKVLIKGKIFQLNLEQEVSPVESTCQRSKTTGHLLIIMPKFNKVISAKNSRSKKKEECLRSGKNVTTYKSPSVSLNDIVNITSHSTPNTRKIESKNVDGNDEPPELE